MSNQVLNGQQLDESFLKKTVSQMINKRNNFGAVLCVEHGDDYSWIGSAGNIKDEDQYFIASVTKLYVTAVVLKLRVEKKLNLEDHISSYLSEEILRGIHMLNGVDYSKELTIKHLISNTSGLPDYFAYKQPGGSTVATELFKGIDRSWTLEETLALIRELKPNFIPGQKGKVNYSDTNYQLLGKIIENITGMSVSEVFQTYIFNELHLTKTYVYEDINDTRPVSLYYKSNKINLPNYMSSIAPEGGIVSTARETMIFLKAFFNGQFFPKEEVEELKQWNLIYFPGQFYYGIGLEKLWTPRIVSPFNPIKEVLGFWGQSGAFAFHNPERDVYFTGTINQASGFGHSAAFKAMINIIKKMPKQGI
ncbi:serine hydrolase domain-containing protein [Bacillus horti]|uniref:CubicO group peptidase (Beta-lactamase class C family) n=1 Tax=Caldalkalibacillus horti TaxID=77523 RepID=A0ABT9W134_9BACI|nr:serine hydrolase domain-containing protein [Bacillus horti]MDQ0166973.1 CubicO group peptidase (beta-lactamase class C family) [Bacillus horti]